MTHSPLSLSRIVTAVLVTLAAISIAACDGSPSSPMAVPTPKNPSTIPSLNAGYFYGDAVVESVTGASTCGPSPQVGNRSTGLRWDEVVVQNGRFLIAYDFEWVNGADSPRYEGTLNSLQFADDYQHPDYPMSSCQFRESSISGAFSADFRSFELRQTMVYGPPAGEHRVVTFHRAARQ